MQWHDDLLVLSGEDQKMRGELSASCLQGPRAGLGQGARTNAEQERCLPKLSPPMVKLQLCYHVIRMPGLSCMLGTWKTCGNLARSTALVMRCLDRLQHLHKLSFCFSQSSQCEFQTRCISLKRASFCGILHQQTLRTQQKGLRL